MAHSKTIAALKTIHHLITGEKRILLTEEELIQRYSIEYIILENMVHPQIADTARCYRGCHGESGISVRISTNYGWTELFYIKPETNPDAKFKTNPDTGSHNITIRKPDSNFVFFSDYDTKAYNLTIYQQDPKFTAVCHKIYRREAGQAIEDGWIAFPESNIAATKRLLGYIAQQHVS